MKLFMKLNKRNIIIWLAVFLFCSLLVSVYLSYQIKNTVQYRIAEEFLSKNALVGQFMGMPLTYSMNSFTDASVRYFADGTATANFQIKINGPKAKGIAVINLEEDSTGWQITSANLHVDGNGSYNLLAG
jgi:hypothetical protein